MMKKNILYSLLLCSMFLAFLGYAGAETGSDKESAVPNIVAQITDIDIQDYTVKIAADQPFTYTVYKPGDPYKIVVDLPNVTVGAFKNRIVSNMAGITEIIPSQIEAPLPKSKLEILLQTPSLFKHEYKNNTLIITVIDELSKKEYLSERVSEEKEDKPNLASAEQKPLPKATEITGISFEKSEDTIKLLIKGNGSMIPNVFPLDNRIVIDIYDVVLNTQLPATVISPVKGIRSGKHDDKIRLVIDIKEKTNFDVTATGDSVVVALKQLEKEPFALPIAKGPAEKMETEKEAEKVKGAEILAKAECGAYLEGKENVNFDFQDQDIVPIIRLFADIAGCNLFVHPDVKGNATMKFRDVPWNQALDTILKTFSLGKQIEGNIIRVAPHTVFTKESEEAAKAQEAGIKAELLETKIFPISYADVSVVEASIKNSKILTSRGSMSVDKRTSTMVIKDIASVFLEVENLLVTLDKPTPQVLIEARIVEVSTSDVRDLGIQWGISQPGGSRPFTGLTSLGVGPFTGENFLVDFPGGAGRGAGSGFAFGILNHSKTAGLDLQLSALEDIGKSKIISNPRIVTSDNEKAKIMQGESIPYPQATAEGTVSAAFKDVVISVEVTPHITPANSIFMSVKTTKEDFKGFVIIGYGNAPRTTKIEGDTKVLIENGETLVIGGVYKKKETDSSSGVPGLMKIPILGWLFKKDKTEEEISELMIFITPRII